MDGNLVNAISAITGATSKAILMIHKTNPNVIERAEEARKPVGGRATGLGAAVGMFQEAEALKDKAKTAVNVAKSALDSVGLNAAAGSPEYADYFKLQVQYNPSSVSINGRNGTVFGRAVTDATDGVMNQVEYNMKTYFHVDLIFDDTNNNDAFTTVETPTTIEGAANTIKSVAMMANNTEFSVRPYVEGLLGALFDPCAKQVVFVWGKQAFKGELTEIRPTYTMFNKNGEPIRAKVSITILQDGGNNDSAYWKKAYKRMGFK